MDAIRDPVPCDLSRDKWCNAAARMMTARRTFQNCSTSVKTLLMRFEESGSREQTLVATLALFCGGCIAARPANVRFGSKADVRRSCCDVCFTPESGHDSDIAPCPLSAKSGHGSDAFFRDEKTPAHWPGLCLFDRVADD